MFYIIKGKYHRGVGQKFFNKASQSDNWIGGYDPTSPTTEEWYQLKEVRTHLTLAASQHYDRVLEKVKDYINTYHTKEALYKMLDSINYGLDRSKTSRCLCEQVFNTYGHHFSADVRRMEDEAYMVVRDNAINPMYKKVRSRLKKANTTEVTHTKETPVKDTNTNVGVLKKMKRPKRKVNTIKLAQ